MILLLLDGCHVDRSTPAGEERGEVSGLSTAAMEELESRLLEKIMAKLPPGKTAVSGEQLPNEKGT